MNSFLTDEEYQIISPLVRSKDSLLSPTKDVSNKNKLMWITPPPSDVKAVCEFGDISNNEASLLLNIANKSIRRFKSDDGELSIKFLAYEKLVKHAVKKHQAK